MRKFSLMIVLMLVSNLSKGDVLDSAIDLKGYFVVRYEKAEIIDLYRQEVRKQRGESFKMLNDLETHTRFKLDLDIDAVKKNSAKISLFFLTKVNRYNPYTIYIGLTPWYPYISD